MKWDKILKLLGIILVTAVVAVAAVKPLIPGVQWLPFTNLIKQGLDLKEASTWSWRPWIRRKRR